MNLYLQALTEMSNFIEMNDTANKKLLDHVRRKHSKGSVSLKKLQLVKSLGSQERMIDSLTSLNVGTAYTISSLTELIDEKDKVRAMHVTPSLRILLLCGLITFH